MAETQEQIIRAIENFINKHGKPYSAWYVGISKDAEHRLFEEHKVRRNDPNIYKSVYSSYIARRIEEHFHILGAKGGGGGGEDANEVYAYMIKPYTTQ